MSAAPVPDYSESCVLLGRLSGRIFGALNDRKYDDAVVMIDHARGECEKLLAAAWAGKRVALG